MRKANRKKAKPNLSRQMTFPVALNFPEIIYFIFGQKL